MKEFLVHKLHSANNLEAINLAVMAIFVHLRKVRTTNTIQLRESSTSWRPSQVTSTHSYSKLESILTKFSFMLHVHELKYICIYTHVHVHVCHCSLCVHCTVYVYLLYMYVLGTHKLMLVTYEEFEQVHVQCKSCTVAS